jgi:NAD(P)-dependent dehydrogenase (short-subunit alcohol dehydrogenase family)
MPLSTTLGNAYKALIIGVNGAIGSALFDALQNDPHCFRVIGLSRTSDIPVDITDESSIQKACTALSNEGPFDLIVLATGVLHEQNIVPEKKLDALQIEHMQRIFHINTFGPALVIKHFHRLLSKKRSLFVCVSAKVGSIEDNRLGGWYSYRASKAALNMLIKTAGIEIRRTYPETTVVALHPGTVKSRLSSPFGGEKTGQIPAEAAQKMLLALSTIPDNAPTIFLSYDGSTIPW